MKKFKSLSLILLSLFILAGCGEEEKIESSGANNGEYQGLIAKADEIQEALVQRRILSGSSDRDRQGFAASIRDARNALVRLRRNSDDKLGIQLGYRALKEIERLRVLRGDSGVLTEFYREVGSVISEAASDNGIDLRDLIWSQYSYAFSDAVAPFINITDGASWSTGVSLDKSYIRVKGIGKFNRSWLLSPSFDLRNIKNPGFKFSHNTNVERKDSVTDGFNRVLINQTVFKVLVSTTYNDGDKLDIKEWTDVSHLVGTMPAGVDFHTVESKVVSLKNFVGEKTTVAFLFNEEPRVTGPHYLSWQINRFELLGAGNLDTITPRTPPLLLTEVEGSDLSPFKTLGIEAGAPRWEFIILGGSSRFAKVSARGGVGESWLLTPRYELGSNLESVSLTLKEVVNNANFPKMEIMISTDYNGDDPKLSTWTKLERTDVGEIPGGKWTDVVTGPYDFSPYIGQSFVIGFKMTSEAGDSHEWEIATLTFNGQGDKIHTSRYELTYKAPDSDEDQVPTEVFKTFNFNNGDEGFKSEVVNGDPAKFEATSRDGRQYFTINAFKGKNVGVVRFVSPKVTLNADGNEKISVNVTQNLNKFDPSTGLTKIYLRSSTGEMEELKFEKTPSGINWDIVTSENLVLDDKWKGEEAEIVFEYTSTSEVYPLWSLYEINFGTIDSAESLK